MEENLKYLKEFMEETFGAICFYNDIGDGWKNFEDSCKSVNTLSIYFPNEIDLGNKEVCNRLTAAAGSEFYKMYKNTSDFKVTPAMGSIILVQFVIDDKTLCIKKSNGGLCASPVIQFLIDYFIGKNFGQFYNFNSLSDIATNNGFSICKGKNIKVKMENYLQIKYGLTVTKENGFYVEKTKEVKTSNNKIISVKDDEPEILAFKEFNNFMDTVQKIQGQRNVKFNESLKTLTKKDWANFKRLIGVDNLIEKNSDFED